MSCKILIQIETEFAVCSKIQIFTANKEVTTELSVLCRHCYRQLLDS